jgi:hypothetical protein
MLAANRRHIKKKEGVLNSSAKSCDKEQQTSSPCWLAAKCNQKIVEDQTNDSDKAKCSQLA